MELYQIKRKELKNCILKSMYNLHRKIFSGSSGNGQKYFVIHIGQTNRDTEVRIREYLKKNQWWLKFSGKMTRPLKKEVKLL